MFVEGTPEAPHGDENVIPDTDTADADTDTAESDTGEGRTPLEKVRSEARNLRERAKAAETRADELARALFTARVNATGKLSDATDLEYNADILDDSEGIAAAIEALIETKPHLKARKVSGGVGQGERGAPAKPKDFSSLFR